MGSILVVGRSTRAAAASAGRAGFAVHAVDAHADLDQHPNVTAHMVRRGFGPRAAVRTAARIACPIVIYLSPFENHPDAVARLAAGRTLWGNSPAVLHAVRDPQALADAARRHGCPAPRLGGGTGVRWMMKPFASGGGRGVREWRPDTRVRRHHYLQERLDGVLASVTFVANRSDAVLVGMTRQLAGLAAVGAKPFAYCGSVVDPTLPEITTMDAVRRLASIITREFELVGVNVLDIMLCDGVPYVLEVNPRWSGSCELLELTGNFSLFEAHQRACVSGTLPSSEPSWRACRTAVGKAIVYARSEVTAGDTTSWLRDSSIRDVPRPHTKIAAGGPICTVFASGASARACLETLEERAHAVYARMTPCEVPAA